MEEIPDTYWHRTNNALFCLKPDNRFRILVAKLAGHSRFDGFILAMILMNSLLMAWERPSIQDGSPERWFLDMCNNIFVFIFSLEFMMKVIAGGMFVGPEVCCVKPLSIGID